MNRREYIKHTTLFLGYAISATAVADLLLACNSEASLQWKPVFFNQHQAATITEIAETICPKTNTPGAKELGIPQFIDKLVKELLTEKDQQFLIDGIKELDDICKNKYSKKFTECNTSNKEAVLIELDKSSAPLPLTMWGKPLEANPRPVTFFRKMKNLVLMGYFTSEKIGKEFLVYDPIPGKHIPCMPLQNQNAWTE
jgi:hypothetical protein